MQTSAPTDFQIVRDSSYGVIVKKTEILSFPLSLSFAVFFSFSLFRKLIFPVIFSFVKFSYFLFGWPKALM